jgi:hypothetical protein
VSKRAIYESAVEAGFVGLIVFGFDRRWVVAIATWVVWLGYAVLRERRSRRRYEESAPGEARHLA